MEHFVHEVGEHRVKSKGERAKYFVQFNILTEGTLRTQNVTFLVSRTDIMFVKKLTPPDFQAKNLYRKFHRISTVFVKNSWQ